MVTKREFNNHWRDFFLEMTDEELYTICAWVHGMRNAFLWEPFVEHAVYELEVARIDSIHKVEQEHGNEDEVLH